jgi:uncharacterized protein
MEEGMRSLAVAAIATVLSGTALAGTAAAQTGPSFDCAKSSTAIERTICKDPELAAADRQMAAAYKALVDKLTGPAKEQQQKEQARWIAARNQVCSDGALEMPFCLRNRMETRIVNLRALADGSYPDISPQTIIKIGKVKAKSFTIDASYPQFDGKSANFAAVNTWFADRTKIAVADHVPDADEAADRQQNWSYEQSYELYRPGPDAISVATTYYGFTGGAHGYGAISGALVDLRSGKMLEPDDVFAVGDKWRLALRNRVTADLKKQFVERPGFDDALAADKMDEMLGDPERYVWRADGLSIVFNQYEIAAYVMGRYFVRIPYADLKPLLRPDAPVGK